MFIFHVVYCIDIPDRINIRTYEPPNTREWQIQTFNKCGYKNRRYVIKIGKADLLLFLEHCDLILNKSFAILSSLTIPEIPGTPGRPIMFFTHPSGYTGAYVAVERADGALSNDRQRRALTRLIRLIGQIYGNGS